MIAEFHDRLGNPQRRPCTRVVVYDDFGNPLAVVLKLGPTAYEVHTVDQPKFHDALRLLGINKTVVVDKLEPGHDLRPGSTRIV